MNKKPSLSMRSIRSILKHHLPAAVLLAAAAGASVWLSLIPPLILKQVIDQNITGHTLDGLQQLALWYAGVYLLLGAAEFLKGYLLSYLGQKLIHEIRMRMMEKIQRLTASYYTGHTPAQMTSRFVSDVASVSDLFTDGVVSMLVDGLKIIGVIISIGLFSRELMIVALCAVPLIGWITRVYQNNVRKAQTDNFAQLGQVNSHISETVRCFSMIRSYGAQESMEHSYRQKLADNFRTRDKVNFYDSTYSPLIQMVRAGMIVFIALGAAGIGWNAGISIGMLAASVDYISSLLDPIESLGEEFQSIQSGISGLKRIDEFDSLPEEAPKDSSLSLEKVVQGGIREIVFDHLTFGYEPERIVLNDFCLKVEGGSAVTFMGRTGIGKTTLFNLIMGLLTPVSGAITINGVRTDRIPNSFKRSLFGYIEQDFTFVEGDVYRQISLGDPAVTDAMVEKACAFAGLDAYIRTLPDGYHTAVKGTESFSWGQRQLLAVARAVVFDPPILLLDEMTAALDAKTEQDIIEILGRASRGRTILSISHRESSLMKNSRIIEMQEAQAD